MVLALAGCATRPGGVEPLPWHPFPRWVGELEVGKSDAASVRERFGEPDAIEDRKSTRLNSSHRT